MRVASDARAVNSTVVQLCVIETSDDIELEEAEIEVDEVGNKVENKAEMWRKCGPNAARMRPQCYPELRPSGYIVALWLQRGPKLPPGRAPTFPHSGPQVAPMRAQYGPNVTPRRL